MKASAIVQFSIWIFTILFFPAISSSAQPGQAVANNITIAYESFGSKNNETILLISGTNAQLSMWPVEFCNKLVQKGFRVIRYDNRDIGLSTKFDKAGLPDWAAISKALQEKKTAPLAYTLEDMALDAVGLLDALGIKKAHIVGASMGAMIAQRVAYIYPDRTLSLTSIMGGGGSPTFPLIAKPDIMSKIPAPGAPNDTSGYINREILARTALYGPIFPPNKEKLIEEIKADVKRSYYPDGLSRQGAASLVAFYAGKQDKLKTIKVSTVVIHGTEDPLVIIDAGKDVAANIPNAEFVAIQGMGHSLPEQLIDELVNHISKNALKTKN